MHFEEWASKNLRDRYFSLIERLKGKEEIANKCTIPFVPYVGANYCDAKPKILIIGKATFGWGKGDEGQGSGALKDVLDMDDHDLWKHLVELPKEFIEGEIIPFYGGEAGHYHGPFWRRIYQLSGKLLVDHPVADYKRERQRSEKCFKSIAWSNVFKVGALKSEGGNPNKALRDIQKEENEKEGNAFEEEIAELRLDVAIFSTGPPDEYDKHIKDLLPNTSMKDVGPERLKIKEIEGLGCPAFRTYHFQYYFSNEKFEQVVDCIRDRMNGTVTEG